MPLETINNNLTLTNTIYGDVSATGDFYGNGVKLGASQTITFDENNKLLSISDGNTISLSATGGLGNSSVLSFDSDTKDLSITDGTTTLTVNISSVVQGVTQNRTFLDHEQNLHTVDIFNGIITKWNVIKPVFGESPFIIEINTNLLA
jgi:hypothetical protein